MDAPSETHLPMIRPVRQATHTEHNPADPQCAPQSHSTGREHSRISDLTAKLAVFCFPFINWLSTVPPVTVVA